jgi:hypothetical protein
MPIVIDELTVTVNVEDTSNRVVETGGAPLGFNPENENKTLIAACTAQVLDILNKKKER